MKTFVCLLLLVAILTSSFLSYHGLSALKDYQIGPVDYFSRWAHVFENYPSYEWKRPTYDEPSYFTRQDLTPSFSAWNNITVDSILDVPEAIVTFCNNLITKMREFFVSIGGLVPKLWRNVEVLFAEFFAPVKNFFSNIVDFVKNFFTAKEWWNAFLLAIYPIDWQQAEADRAAGIIHYELNYNKLPFGARFGNKVAEIFGNSWRIEGGYRGGR